MLIHKTTSYWFFFIFIKALYCFIAVYIYSESSSLGDSFRYISGPTFGASSWFYNSTQLMDTLGHGLSLIFGEFIPHLIFMLLAVFGLYYPLKQFNSTPKQLLIVLAVLSFPSFGIWTSIVSKESLTVFFMGIILAFIINLIQKTPQKNIILTILAFYLCALIKPQYLIAISSLIIFIVASRFFTLKSIGKVSLLLLSLIISLLSLYFFRNEISDLSFIMPQHFSVQSNSTRVNTIWIEKYDVFKNMLYGMYISFVGPTFQEAIAKPIQAFVLLESYVIIIFLVIFAKNIFFNKKGKMNIYYTTIITTTLFWLLFVHYPFGVLNPGSAIRYRQGFHGFIVILFFFSYINASSFKKINIDQCLKKR